MQAPTFFVCEHQPIYCQITDGLIGSSIRPVDAARTMSHALASARRRSYIEHAGFGDGYFDVRVRNEYGSLVPAPTGRVEPDDFDDMPF